MRQSLADWIVAPAGQIPEASAAFRSLTAFGFSSDAHSREAQSQRATQSGAARALGAPRSAAFSHPGLYGGRRTPGDSPRSLARGRRAPAAQRRLVPVGRCPPAGEQASERAGGPRAAPGGGSAAGLGGRARSPGSRARPGRPGARRRARLLPPEPRGRGSAAGGGGPSSAAGAAGQAVPVPQHCCAAESAGPPLGRACLPGHLERVCPVGTWVGRARVPERGVGPATLPRRPSPGSCYSVPGLCLLTWAGSQWGGSRRL